MNQALKALRRLLGLISRRHIALVSFDLLVKTIGRIVRDRKIRNAAWDFLVAYDATVKEMPEGLDKECHVDILRHAKGQMKTWRFWFIKQEMMKAKGGKQEKLKRQLEHTKLRFSRGKPLRESSPLDSHLSQTENLRKEKINGKRGGLPRLHRNQRS